MSRLHQSFVYSRVGNSPIDHRLPELSFGQSSTSKPGLSFPLGTGLVVLIILFVSALFSFFYHWLSLRKLGASILPATSDSTQQLPPQITTGDNCNKVPTICKLDMLPACPPVVFMAGEEMPRFIAMPCPFAHKQASSTTLEKQLQEPIDPSFKLHIRL